MLKKSKTAQGLQITLGNALSGIPLSPNQWTMLAILLAFLGFLALVYRQMPLAIPLFALALLIDAIDGAIAREKGAVTKKGAFIDGVSDRVVEMLMLVGLMFYSIPDVFISSIIWLSLLFFMGSCMTSFVKAYSDHTRAISHKQAMKMSGLFERSERVVLILLAIMLVAISPIYSAYLIIAGVILSSITVAQRIRYVLNTKS